MQIIVLLNKVVYNLINFIGIVIELHNFINVR